MSEERIKVDEKLDIYVDSFWLLLYVRREKKPIRGEMTLFSDGYFICYCMNVDQ